MKNQATEPPLRSLHYHRIADEIRDARFYDGLKIKRAEADSMRTIERLYRYKETLMNVLIVVLCLILFLEVSYLFFVFEVKLNHLPEQ